MHHPAFFCAENCFGKDFFGDGFSAAFHGKFIYSLDNDVTFSARVG
jgi:hypothetical protein